MATWQSTFHLASNRALRDNPGRLVTLLPIDSDQDHDEWWHPSVPESVVMDLSNQLPVGPTLSSDTRAWGGWDGNRIEVEVGQPPNSSVYIRFDLRSFDPQFLECVLRLANALDASLITEEGAVIPATWDVLIKALRESRAASFCRDPRGYIESIANGTLKV